MKKLRVELKERSYDILIKHNLISEAGKIISTLSKLPKRCVILSNSRVFKLYGKKLIKSLKLSNFDVKVFLIKEGEESKSIENALKIYSFMLKNNMNRSTFLIAFGGGVIGDLTGYVAATYMRGIPFVQIPTTLLAQVDSSVGGKVAVNLDEGKNLVGCFYQPKLVLIDYSTLKTLSEKEIRNGMAEVIKYGLIKDRKFFNFLIKNHYSILRQNKNIVEKMIFESVKHKALIVSKDEDEKGIRAILNFGHTFGHAIEKTFKYKKFSHGEAVAIGMYMASLFSKEKGYLKNSDFLNIKESFSLFNLLVNFKTSLAKEIFNNLFFDKKISDKGLTFILIKRIGDVFIKSFFDTKEIKTFVLNFCLK